MEITQESIQKLPKWAQEHIARLQRQTSSAQAQLQRLLDSKTPSSIWINAYANKVMPEKFYLDCNEVTFELGKGQQLKISLHLDEIKIAAPHGRIQIAPNVTNVITVKSVP